ncbi:MAG: Asp-tRNA(Asn)/Glu-tRNA(Gln) amidotransferase subunit GatC [Candidatus Nanohaloarchaea archaeon]
MVDKNQVERVADNARLEIPEEELGSFVDDFEDILEMFQKLEDVDTEDVEPAFHPIDVEPGTREDEEEETLDRDEVFQNTENVEEDQFKGPSV